MKNNKSFWLENNEIKKYDYLNENIECDFERTNHYIYTTNINEVNSIQKEVEALKLIGGENKFKYSHKNKRSNQI